MNLAPTEWTSSPPRPGRGDLIAILVWSAVVVAIFRDAVFFRGALFYFDITEINFPYRDFLAREIRLGRFARWMPGLYCGHPLYSESQAGYWHPLKYLLYPWMSTWRAFNLDTVLSVWLAGLATFGWLRRHVGPAGALTGAGLFALSGFTWAHLVHTSMVNALISVPFAFWALEVAWDGGKLRGLALGALAIACQVFAGHLQDTILTGAALGIVTLFRAATESTVGRKLKTLGFTAILVGLGLVIASVQWIPSKELLDRSPRSGGLTWEQLTYGSWSPELLPTLFVREAYGTRARDTDWMDGFYPYHEMNAYIGIVGLALAVVGAGACRDRWVAGWVVLGIVGGVFMLGRYTFLFDLMHRVPVLGSSRIPVRYHLWVAIAAAALGAVGVDRLGRSGRVSLRSVGGIVGLLLLISIPILVVVYAPAWLGTDRWRTPYHLDRYRWLTRDLAVGVGRTVLLAVLGWGIATRAARAVEPNSRSRLAALLPIVVLIDLSLSHALDVPTIDPAYWTTPPPSVDRLKSDPTLQRVFGLADRSAGEPGYASEKVDFPIARDALAWSLAPVWGIASASGETPIRPRRMLAYTDHARGDAGRFDVEGVSHVLAGTRLAMGVGPPERVGTAYIHRNPKVLPRARLMGDPVYAADEADAIAAMDSIGAAIRDRLIVEDPDRPLPIGAKVAGSARIVVDEPERVEVEAVVADGPAYLVLADTFDPGWSATVDGRPAPIRPAIIAFRAVFLSPGVHRVAFHYTPAGFGLGLTLTAIGGAIALVFLIWPRQMIVLDPAHERLAWPARWPWFVLVAVAAMVIGSTIWIRPGTTVSAHSRWSTAFHRFTWGAGVEAIPSTREALGR